MSLGSPYGAGMYEWVATREFIDAYEQLDDRSATTVDDAIRRLLRNPGEAWGRQGRVVSERWSAWIVEFESAEREFTMYWTFDTARDVVILAFLVVR
jgi:hypothetical protein